MAPALVMAGAVTQYLGAALAVEVFDTLGPVAVASLRVGWSAVLLLAWRRPGRRRTGRAGGRAGRGDGATGRAGEGNARADGGTGRAGMAPRWPLVLFGTSLAVMNLAFYLAIDRLPLGTAVAIEFSGPITVAALGGRRAIDFVAVGLAAVGVLLLADVQWEGNAAGVAFALLAASMWATYIVLGRRVRAAGAAEGLDGLAWATAAGAALIAPAGAWGIIAEGPAPTAALAAVALCAVVALCSNVVPYALDQIVLGRVTAAQFALLSTLLPVTAVAVGAVLLAQRPTGAELFGVALVVAALLVRATRPLPAAGVRRAPSR